MAHVVGSVRKLNRRLGSVRKLNRHLSIFHTEVHCKRMLVGGVTPPTKNLICALVSGGTFKTRPGTFQTRLAVQSKKDLPPERRGAAKIPF